MRTRNVTAHREILASDVNDLINFVQNDMVTIIGDILPVSTGVVTGLDPTQIAYSGLDVTIPSGVICDGDGKFYELLTNTTITLPSASNTYNLYVQHGSTSDLPTSGYVLLDTATRVETYDTVNTRTYDSLTPTGTTTIVHAGYTKIGEATVAGGVITGVSDERIFVTVANIIANTLQGMVNASNNFAKEGTEVSGTIVDTSTATTKWLSVQIGNTSALEGINIDTGTNAGSKGINLNIEGNTGLYITPNGTTSSGIVLIGNASDTSKGIISKDILTTLHVKGDLLDTRDIIIDKRAGTSSPLNVGVTVNQKSESVGLLLNSEENISNTNMIGILVDKTSSENFAKLLSTNSACYDTGIELINGTTSTALSILGTASPISSVGVNIDSVSTGIVIDISGTNECAIAIKNTSVSNSDTAIKLDLNEFGNAIYIKNYYQKGIEFAVTTDMTSVATENTEILFSPSTKAVHLGCKNAPDTLVDDTTMGSVYSTTGGAIQMIRNTLNGDTELHFWNGSGWIQLA